MLVLNKKLFESPCIGWLTFYGANIRCHLNAHGKLLSSVLKPIFTAVAIKSLQLITSQQGWIDGENSLEDEVRDMDF